jgi:DUF971 family protein
MGQPPDPMVVRDTPKTELTLNDISTVGTYALQLYWSDGHSTGIYSWEYLRSACPCEICIEEKLT